MRFPRFFLLVLALFPAASLFAQKKPKESAQVLVTLTMSGYGSTGDFAFRLAQTGQYDWNASSGSFLCYAQTVVTNSGWADGGTRTVLVTPGVSYDLGLFGSWNYGEAKVSAPPGYQVYINGIATETYRMTSDFGGSWGREIPRVTIQPTDATAYLPAGMSLAPKAGDFIWTMSVGSYANGRSAGSLQLRADDVTSSLLDPRTLSILDPQNAEVQLSFNSDGAIQEVRTNQFVAYVRRTSSAYNIEVYDAYAYHPETGDTPYTYYAWNGGPALWPYREFDFTSGGTNAIVIEKIERDGSTTKKDTTWTISRTVSGTNINWNVVETSGIRKTKLIGTKNTSTGVTTETATVENSDGTEIALKATRTYQDYAWGQTELTQEVDDPDGIAATTTWTYNTTSTSSAYGRLQSVTHADGNWERYVYDDSHTGWGNLVAIYRPFQNGSTTASTATSSNCAATLYSYTTDRFWPGNANLVFATLPAGTEVKINNTTVSKNVIGYSTLYGGFGPNYGNRLQDQVIQSYSSSSAYTTTTRTLFHRIYADDQHRGRLAGIVAPDGTLSSFVRYQAHFFDNGDNNGTLFVTQTGSGATNSTWGEYQFNGFASAVSGSVLVSSWDGQSLYGLYMVPNRSTITLTIYNAEGRVWYKVRYVFTGASGGVPSFEFVGMDNYGYVNGVQSWHSASNGRVEYDMYIGASMSGHGTYDGQYVEFNRDSLDRDTRAEHQSIGSTSEYAAQGSIWTHKTFDIAGHTLTEKISSDSSPTANPSDAVRSVHTFNKAGMPTSDAVEADAGNFQTTYAYSGSTSGIVNISTVTMPGGATKITENYPDGTVKSITGTGVVKEYHVITVNGDGTLTKQTTMVSSSGSRWTKVTTDWAGRTIKEEKPAYGGGTFTKQSYYNSSGQLFKTTETGLADTLTEYNAFQQPYRTGLDINANGSLDTASMDRITEADTYFEKDGSNAWWSVKTEKRYYVDNTATATPTTYVKTRLNKFTGYVQSEVVTIDLFGNVTNQKIEVDRGAGNGAGANRLITETTTYPDSTAAEIKVTRNGLVQKQQSKQGLVSRLYYDGRGRLIKQTNPRTDTSTTARTGYVTNSDRVAWRQDTAGNQTNYGYDSTTGLLSSETNPLSKSTYHAYDYLNREVRTWGAATFPVEYAFNDYGEKVGMRTFRTSTDFTTSTWPLSDDTDPKKPDASTWTSGDKTTWAYETATGLLTSKTDASSHAVAYTYNARGQLATRTWSRGTVTTYAYSSTTAEQTGISYSDSTPALTYTYNRLGQTATVTDVTGTRTFAYNTGTTQLSSETLPGYFGGRVLTRAYDTTTTGALGRSTGFSLSGASGSGTEYSAGYGYDAYGRFNALTSGFGPSYSYAYATNSNLIGSVADTASGWTETMTYNSSRDLLDSVDGQFSTEHKAKFAYTYDNLGRRTALTSTGEIFSRYDNGGLTLTWGYDDKSEVTSEQTAYAGTSTAVAGRSDAYTYDPIGNRATATRNGNTSTYTANSLNQYTQRTVPGHVGVSGFAPANATVTINSGSGGITRQGDYYWSDFSVTNSSALWQTYAVASSAGGAFTRTAFVPATPESYTYDLDGNLTSDGRWDYTWDAENRLIAMQSHTALSPSPIANTDARRLEFTYDYLGRRVEKLVRSGYNGSSFATVALDRKFIYDGWNLLTERNASTLAAVNSFVWGLDLTGTLQDGGGVGGLLASVDQTSSTVVHHVYYDGNGNVRGLINRSTGVISAAYEYSAFGELLRSTGAFAQGNPFRFSTKYTEDETGLLQFNRRYYDPRNGRFLGRDPVEEKGGLHLYGFCGNNPINRWDVLGMGEEHMGRPEEEADGGSSSNGGVVFGDPLGITTNGRIEGAGKLPPIPKIGSGNLKVRVDELGNIYIGDHFRIQNNDKNAVEIFSTIAFIANNSPTFARVLDTINTTVKGTTVYKLFGDPNISGGISGETDILFGYSKNATFADGREITGAYTMLHEIGHAYDRITQVVSNYKGPISQEEDKFGGGDQARSMNLIPALEAYATHFANNISAEVKINSGMSIGSLNSYLEAYNDPNVTYGPGSMLPNPRPPGG